MSDAVTRRPWAAPVLGLERWLRRRARIVEFTEDSECMLRLGVRAAAAACRLSDGTAIAVGAPVGEIHLWNEQLPQVRRELGILWAVRIQRSLLRSFALLGERVAADPAWSDVAAFRCEVVFLSRMGRVQIERLARRYGLDLVEYRPTMARRIHDFFDNFLIWALDRCLNPHRAHRRKFMRERYELWISRRALLTRYASLN